MLSEGLVLEPEAIARLERIGGAKFLRQMIELFEREGPERLASALRGEHEGNLAPVAAAAHSLKSSAGNFGALTLREVSQRLERRAMEGDVAAIGPLMRLLEESFAATMQQLEAYKHSLPA